MLLELPRSQKRFILIAADLSMLYVVLWLSLSARFGGFWFPASNSLSEHLMLAVAPILTVITFERAGLYRLVTRYIGTRGVTRIIGCVVLSVLVWSLIVLMSGQLRVPRSVIFIYAILASAGIVASRQAAAILLKSAGIELPTKGHDRERRPVIIYGAGATGVQLLESLRRRAEYEVVAFVDDSETLYGQYMSGVKVYRPERLANLIQRADVKEVLLTVPEVHRQERRLIIDQLRNHPVEIKILPAMEDIASGRVSVTDLRPVEVADLLGRDAVPPNAELLARSTRDKSILVTGAGGSVGSELVRQILRQQPRRLVLLDVSELALYEIDMAAQEILAKLGPEAARPEVVALLGSVLDAALMTEIIRNHSVQTIYHAAAYKHVPIVQHNAVIGIRNNTFGTAVVAECAKALGVERVVFISTDKAVRPTNIMGASKRLAELVLQAHAMGDTRTIFTMVRFGNVLDSSGSVVRRFTKQIKTGGPVTVTHPEVIRYFMSIPEAAELVLQAGSMARGGEVFVLDMGEPVKIDDLARLMIRLSGLEVRDDEHPAGDIAISYSGLRPGEKLYEELLIGANTSGTEHARIMRSDEPFLTPAELSRELDALEHAMKARDFEAIQAILIRTVEGYVPDPQERADAAGKSTAERWKPQPSRTLH